MRDRLRFYEYLAQWRKRNPEKVAAYYIKNQPKKKQWAHRNKQRLALKDRARHATEPARQASAATYACLETGRALARMAGSKAVANTSAATLAALTDNLREMAAIPVSDTFRSIKDLVLTALVNVGGAKYLARQAEANPVAFMGLLGKILPLQITGKDGGPVDARVEHVLSFTVPGQLPDSLKPRARAQLVDVVEAAVVHQLQDDEEETDPLEEAQLERLD